MTRRRRLDVELVRRGLSPSREAARARIAAGEVTVNGAPAAKPARLVHAGDAIEVVGPPPRFVSRAGAKLEAALDAFAIDVAGARCIDVGSSTGGFTDCLLQRGAAHVVAIDVGRGQLHEKVASDPRVTSLERTDVRGVDVAPAAVVTADVSFISLTSVMADLVRLAEPDGDLVLLVKPQFEVGRREASRGRGVVRDEEQRQEAVDRVATSVAEHGAVVVGIMDSAVPGRQGNVEVLLHARRGLVT